MAWYDFLLGKPGKFQQLPTIGPQQQQYLNQFFQTFGGPQGLQTFSEPYLRQFERQIAPGIAGRFASGNALRSSGFQNALAQSGLDLQSNLAQLYQQQQLAAAGLATQPTFENIYRPQTPGLIESILPLALRAAGMALGGPVGGSIGNLTGQVGAKALSSIVGSSGGGDLPQF